MTRDSRYILTIASILTLQLPTPLSADGASPIYEIELPKEGIDTGQSKKNPQEQLKSETEELVLSQTQVKALQRKLRSLAFGDVQESGKIDEPTRDAIRSLQEQYDLVVTGTWNKQTIELIERLSPRPSETKLDE